jgi:hypothetical protein
MSLLALGVTATPAYAGKTATASVSSGAACSANQEMTGISIVLTDIPKWQKVTVNTSEYRITRDHDRWERTGGEANTGTGFYSIAVEGRLLDPPASAWISNNGWDGSFRVTDMSCRNVATPPAPTTTPPTTQPTTPQQPTTGSTTAPPSSVTPPATTTQPGNPNIPVIPGFTSAVPSVPASATASAPGTPSPSPSLHTSAPSASPQTSAPSTSSTAISLTADDGDDTNTFSYEEIVDPEAIADAVTFQSDNTGVSLAIWGVVALLLMGAFLYVARRQKRRSTSR